MVSIFESTLQIIHANLSLLIWSFAIFLSLYFVILALVSTHTRKKHILLSAKPLNLTEEQIRHTRMKRGWNPPSLRFRFPATYATPDEVSQWADLTAPRLGHGYLVGKAVVLPGKLWFQARYEVEFVRLKGLRK
ncbi:hypothetical protein [Bifidobacterium crudilactis]|uniref:hypothetical protein n=1 Tax=Bifidobacterium crudilactis TaxID=327277 RepID=UPI0023566C01|nr:hypothetical protein [Bifidobacterium crudilactis]MCI1218553.1 hypothetical protein [Bifidobacterium crudilactis]